MNPVRTFGMFYALCLFVSVFSATLKAENSGNRTYVLSDVEGSRQKIVDFFQNIWDLEHELPSDSILTQGKLDADKVSLPDDVTFIFMGDAIDKGKENIEVLTFLLKLKEKYPERVVFIAGNRDINKLRLIAELSPKGIAAFGEAPSEDNIADHGIYGFRLSSWKQSWNQENALVGDNPPPLEITKMKFLLKHTMGAATLFEDVKAELFPSLPSPPIVSSYDANHEDQTFKTIKGLVGTDGLLTRYLKQSKLAYVHAYSEDYKALFVHGGISEESYLKVPEAAKSLNSQISTLAPTPRNNGDQKSPEVWAEQLNNWAQKNIKAALSDNAEDAMELIKYVEPPVVKDTKTGLAKWAGFRSDSVVQGRLWNKDFNLSPIAGETGLHLVQHNVKAVVTAHSPVGMIPAILRHEFEDGKVLYTLATDISFSGTSAGVIISENAIRYKVSLKNEGYDVIADTSEDKEIGDKQQDGSFRQGRVVRSTTISPENQSKIIPEEVGRSVFIKWVQGTAGGHPLDFGVPVVQFGND